MLKIFLSHVQQGFQQILFIISVVFNLHCHVFVIGRATPENAAYRQPANHLHG